MATSCCLSASLPAHKLAMNLCSCYLTKCIRYNTYSATNSHKSRADRDSESLQSCCIKVLNKGDCTGFSCNARNDLRRRFIGPVFFSCMPLGQRSRVYKVWPCLSVTLRHGRLLDVPRLSHNAPSDGVRHLDRHEAAHRSQPWPGVYVWADISSRRSGSTFCFLIHFNPEQRSYRRGNVTVVFDQEVSTWLNEWNKQHYFQSPRSKTLWGQTI